MDENVTTNLEEAEIVKTGTKVRKDLKEQLVQIRKSTGMSRRQFAEYLFYLIAYKIEMEKPHK